MTFRSVRPAVLLAGAAWMLLNVLAPLPLQAQSGRTGALTGVVRLQGAAIRWRAPP